MSERKIIACYLRAGSDILEDHVLNRLAARMAPTYGTDTRDPIVHAELYFPNTHDPSNGLSAGICYGGRAFMHPKRFSRNSWEFHSVPVSEEQFLRAKEFCDRQKGAGFNYRGFFTPRVCGLGHSYRAHGLATLKKMPWYCSELVAYTLMHAGVLDGAAAYEAAAHPNAAYNIIEQHCTTFIDCARNYRASKLEL